MQTLVLGISLFLATHAITIAQGFRASLIERLGANGYKGLYAVGSFIGLMLMIFGYGQYRAEGYVQVWNPPFWFGHIVLLLMLPAMVFLLASNFKGRIAKAVKHPMLLSVKIWAVSHLISNGDLGTMVLAGSLLAWAVISLISQKRRAVPSTSPAPVMGLPGDIISVVGGVALWALFVFYAHEAWIGVAVWPGR